MVKATTIGQRLRALREFKKLTQEQLAHKASVTTGYLSKVERGEQSNPSLKSLSKISTALGVTVTDLLKEELA